MIGRGPLFLLFFACILLISFSFFFKINNNLLPNQLYGFHTYNHTVFQAACIPAMSTVVHIVLLKFAAGTTSDAASQACSAFIELQKTCLHPETKKPYILSLKGGLDNSPEGLQNGLTHGFVLEFATNWDRDYYVEADPAHQAFKGLLKGTGLANITVLDFVDGTF